MRCGASCRCGACAISSSRRGPRVAIAALWYSAVQIKLSPVALVNGVPLHVGLHHPAVSAGLVLSGGAWRRDRRDGADRDLGHIAGHHPSRSRSAFLGARNTTPAYRGVPSHAAPAQCAARDQRAGVCADFRERGRARAVRRRARGGAARDRHAGEILRRGDRGRRQGAGRGADGDRRARACR